MPDYKITIAGQRPFPATAPNPSVARNWAVRERVKVEPLTTRDAIEFGKAGVDIIDVEAEGATPPAIEEPEAPKPEGETGDAEASESE